ncbi:MAG: hypothetical protein Ta2F_09260 [Termitinemataceae bacterium]|nr:MAG: hypothetical protein Ta2F_09260 [Termitinemataceae bacterium]
MKIFIDEKEADIVPQNEKTLGDVLSAIETWLGSAGLCVSSIDVDGDASCTSNMNVLFGKSIDSVSQLKISTSLVAELHLDALIEALQCLIAFNNSDFSDIGVNEKAKIKENWILSAGSRFLLKNDKHIFSALNTAFNGGGEENLRQTIMSRCTEIERMIKTPSSEFAALENKIQEAVHGLEDLPLDMQTGKDKQASEAIELFSKTSDKMFYLINLLLIDIDIDKTVETKLDEFNSALKEFLSAYENKDLVLTGDLAEYEIAPRLIDIYNNVKEILQQRVR